MDNNQPFKFTVCAMCGKQFIRQPGSIYNVKYRGRMNRCCSYTCYQKALKVKEELLGANRSKQKISEASLEETKDRVVSAFENKSEDMN